MSRYIDADAVLKHFDSAEQIGFGIIETQLAKELIQDAPTADVVEVVHGEWKLNNLNGFKIYDCSNCGIHMEARWNYCPHCGADMRGGDAK